MNKFFGIGRLTKDPELRNTSSGISVCTFTVAINRQFKKDETDFLSVVAWKGLADNCGKYLSKGKQVAVFGRIQTRNYEDKNGQRRYITEIVADDVEFLSPKTHITEQDLINDTNGFTPIDDEVPDSEMPF